MTAGQRRIEHLRNKLEQARQDVLQLEQALKKACEDNSLEGVVLDTETHELDSATKEQLSQVKIEWISGTGVSDRAYFGLRDLGMHTAFDIYQNRRVLETKLWQMGVSLTTLKELREWALAKEIEIEPCQATLQPEPLLTESETEHLSSVKVADSGLNARARKALFRMEIFTALDAYEKRDDLLWNVSEQKRVGRGTLKEVRQWATALKIPLNTQVGIAWSHLD